MKSTKLLCALVLFTISATLLTGCASAERDKYSGSWAQVADILKQVNPPVFPDKEFNIKDFGAVDDAKTDSRMAIMSAIAACAKAGGGRVVVPAGTYLTNGPIHLESNIDFHLAKGSKVLFGTNCDYDDYLPPVLTRLGCIRTYNYSPLVYAYQKTNIALTGKGELDGQAKDTWYSWSKRKRSTDQSRKRKMNKELVPLKDRVFVKGRRRRPAMIQFYECQNILVEGIGILDSPAWCLHPVFSKNITIRNIRFNAKNANNDGIDVDSCEDVYIHDVIFDNNDDCIVLKSGRGPEGRLLSIPTRNVYIRDCIFNAYTAIAIGSEMGGSIYNIFAENSHAESKCKRGLYIKGNRQRGGEVSHIRYRNMQFLETSREMLAISGTYGISGGDFPPYYHDIRWEDIDAEGSCMIGLRVEGHHDVPVENVVLKNINVKTARKNKQVKNVKNLITQNVIIVDEKLPNFENLPPDVYAGPDHKISNTSKSVILKGNVKDDGKPTDELTYKWSVIQGDAKAVTFESPEAITTKASFAKEGTYIIKLTADDSEQKGYHFTMVKVGDQPEGMGAVKKPIFTPSNTL